MSRNRRRPPAARSAALRSVGDEEVFAAYLEGCLRRALAALDAARAALHANPGDAGRAGEVMRRVHALRDLRAQCDVQRARLRAARAAAGLDAPARGRDPQPPFAAPPERPRRRASPGS